MIGNLIQKIGDYQEKRKTNQIIKRADDLLKIAENIKENGGNIRQASDLSWYAIYIIEEELGDMELTNEYQKRANRVQFGAYDPIRSGCPQIQELASKKAKREYREEKVKEIITLERIAEERLKLRTEETKKLALEYHAKAIEVAKNLNDPEILQKVKDRFNEVSKEIYQ